MVKKNVNLEREEFWELTRTQDNWENFRISGCLLALTQQAIPAPEPRLGPSGLLVENEFEVSSLELTFKTLHFLNNNKIELFHQLINIITAETS